MKPQTKPQTKHMKTAPLKKMTSDFASTFEAFKDANDARLAALESKQSDGLLDDKVARINAALDVQAKQIENLALASSRPVLGKNGGCAPVNTEAKSACCLLYTSPSPRDQRGSRMPSSA